MIWPVQILAIAQSITKSILDAIPSIAYIPLAPAVLYFIISTQLSHDLYVLRTTHAKEYDYIVIGAGSAGSVMASRLSEDPSVTVLLLEAGMAENIVSDVPMAALVLQKTPMDWSYETLPQDKACLGMIGRKGVWAKGKAMGGSSTINTMVYMRGNPLDYQNWAFNYNATGWSWPEVFPYFIKAEDNRDPAYVNSGYHGRGGPLTVTSVQDPRKVSLALVESAPYLGFNSGDVNGPTQQKFTMSQRTIRDGLRCSVAKAYLENLQRRPNLDILIKAHVRRIIFENKRAVGVEFDRFPGRHTVRARREVILSAGAINSPQILMLSGIGPREHLTAMGIPVIQDLRVGDNLQEHYLTGMSFVANQTIAIDVVREVAPWNIYDYFVTRNNSLTNNLVEGTLFYKTKYANPALDWPDIQMVLLPATLATDFGLLFYKLQGMAFNTWKQVFKPYLGLNTFSLYPVLERPESRGWVRLRSTNPYDHPIIEPNIFDKEQDLNVLVEGMKFALQIAQTPPFQRYGVKPFTTKFPGCESLELYSEEYLKCMVKVYTYIMWHPSGTAKMGDPSDPTTVVDPQLRVKGVTGLRVVDGSVMPLLTTGNTNAPIVMIAEKIADQMKGRKLCSFVPPMSPQMISRLPSLPYEPFCQKSNIPFI